MIPVSRPKVTLRPASPSHIGTIARRMRADDVIECSAFGHSPKQALRLALQTSSICLTAFVDDRPEAMMGLVVNSALCGEGAPWMLGTEAIYDHPREMIRMGPRILKLFSDSTPSMTGLVGAGNNRAIRLLRRWGFQVGATAVESGGVGLLSFERG